MLSFLVSLIVVAFTGDYFRMRHIAKRRLDEHRDNVRMLVRLVVGKNCLDCAEVIVRGGECCINHQDVFRMADTRAWEIAHDTPVMVGR
jgi:hypothetical protein